MTDITQVLLVAVITVLTTILTIIGIQVVHILKEFRKTIQTINQMLADAEKVTSEISGSLVELAGVTSGIKTVLGFFNLFSKKKELKGAEDEG